MDPIIYSRRIDHVQPSLSHCSCATLQLPPPPAALEGAGYLSSAKLQATALLSTDLQGKDFSVRASIFNTALGSMEQRHFGVNYEQEKDGMKTPKLFEKVSGTWTEMKAKLHFYADGKLYDAQGELKGDFAFDRSASPDFLRASVIQAPGEFRDRSGRLTRFDNAQMKLDGELVVIVNAPPPNLVRSIKDVETPTVEDQRGNPHGLFGNTQKKTHCEVEWVTTTEQARRLAARPSHSDMAATIKDPSTTKIGEGRWQLKDGTVVGRESDNYFILKHRVLPTTIHDVGSTVFNLGRTGIVERIYLPLSTDNKPAAPSLPESKGLPAPAPLDIRPGRNEVPPAEIVPGRKEAPPAEIVPGRKEAAAPPSLLPMEPKAIPKSEMVFDRDLVEHQLRILQRGRAVTNALLRSITEPNYSAPKTLEIESATVRVDQKELWGALRRLVDTPLDRSESALMQPYAARPGLDGSSKGAEAAQAAMITAFEALGEKRNRARDPETLRQLSARLGDATKQIILEHGIKIDPDKAIPLTDGARAKLIAGKLDVVEFGADLEALLTIPKRVVVTAEPKPAADTRPLADHYLRLAQLGVAQLKAMTRSLEDPRYQAPAITGVNSDAVRADPKSALGAALDSLLAQPLQAAEDSYFGGKQRPAAADTFAEESGQTRSRIAGVIKDLPSTQSAPEQLAKLRMLSASLEIGMGRIARAHGYAKFDLNDPITIDEAALKRIKEVKAVPEWLTIGHVEQRNKEVREALK